MNWPTRRPPPPSGAAADCRCGHVAFGHQHYRRGTDCAFCPCRRYRKTSVPVPAVAFRERPAAAA